MFVKSLPWYHALEQMTSHFHEIAVYQKLTSLPGHQSQEGPPEEEEKEVEEVWESDVSLSARGKIQIETAQVA